MANSPVWRRLFRSFYVLSLVWAGLLSLVTGYVVLEYSADERKEAWLFFGFLFALAPVLLIHVARWWLLWLRRP